MMSSLIRFRVINLLGSIFFITYGLLIGAFPIVLMNGFIAAINIYYLVQMIRQKDYFTMLEVPPDSEYLRAFVNFYKEDISRFFPDYEHSSTPQARQLDFFTLRNMVPAGLFSVNFDGEEARIILDYVVPNFRDFQVAHFIFIENAAFFANHGIKRFISDPGTAKHEPYLVKMGFKKMGENYVLELGK
jgi:hypothetical protein